MHVAAFLLGLALLLNTLWEAFETIILPRTVTRSNRVTRFLYVTGWRTWVFIAKRQRTEARTESLLGYFGPMSLPLLLGFWAISLVFGFALMQWGINMAVSSPEPPTFVTYLYYSGITFFTVGFGDVTSKGGEGRLLSVFEGGVGIGFLAIIIGYLPVLYQAFSRREVSISMLDARAGSPPSATEMLRRYQANDDLKAVPQLLRDWERWAAELLESHLSYPVLAYYRSQHDRESWLSALTMILDTCALIMVGVDSVPSAQAKLTFAMARHAIIDISLIFGADPVEEDGNRLPPETLKRIRDTLTAAGIPLQSGDAADTELADIRATYEPFVIALSRRFLFPLPPWVADPSAVDNWVTSAWQSIDHRHFT